MTNLAERLADTVSKLGVKTAYGEPVEVNGVTLIPVALVQFGFGAGSDASGDESEEGASGGGGGGMSIPLGAYVRDINGLRFEPNIITLMAVGIPFLWVAGKAGARLIKALKR